MQPLSQHCRQNADEIGQSQCLDPGTDKNDARTTAEHRANGAPVSRDRDQALGAPDTEHHGAQLRSQGGKGRRILPEPRDEQDVQPTFSRPLTSVIQNSSFSLPQGRSAQELYSQPNRQTIRQGSGSAGASPHPDSFLRK